MNNLKVCLFSLAILISTNIFSAGKMDNTALSSLAFAEASANRSAFAEASANRSAFANASSDTSSSSSSRSEITSRVSFTRLGIENNTISSWTNPTKFSELTPFQKIQLKELEKYDQIGKFPKGLSQIIGSYTEEFSKEATDDLWNALKDKSLNKQTRTERVKNAIDQFANVNYPKDPDESIPTRLTPLEYSILYKYFDVVEILIRNKKNNVNVTIKTISWGETPLIQLYNYYCQFSFSSREADKKKVFELMELLLKENYGNNILDQQVKEFLFKTIKVIDFYLTEIMTLFLNYSSNPNIYWENSNEISFEEMIKSKNRPVARKIYDEWKKKVISSSSCSSNIHCS